MALYQIYDIYNSHFLASSGGITKLQKSLFSDTLL